MIPDPEGPPGHPAHMVPSEACQPLGKDLPWTCWARTGWDSHQGQGRAVQKSPNAFCHCLQPQESSAANSQPWILPGSGHCVPASPEPRLSPEPFCCAVGQLWLLSFVHCVHGQSCQLCQPWCNLVSGVNMRAGDKQRVKLVSVLEVMEELLCQPSSLSPSP